MNASEKKRYLSQYYRAKKTIKIICDQIEELEAAIDGTGMRLSGMPSGGGVSDPVQQTAVCLAELKARLKKEQARAKLKCAKIVMAINTVSNENQRAVLTMRYVRCMKWPDIASELHYSDRQAFRYHDDGINCIRIR